MNEKTKSTPQLAEGVFVAEGAIVKGNVKIGIGSSVWYHATVRASGVDTGISIGANTNIQDNCVLHVDKGNSLEIGNGVTIGHSAVVHGKKVGDNTLIGMGAILLNGSVVGKNCIIGAGALVTQNTEIPDNSLVLGQPGRVVRSITSEECEANRENAMHYVREASCFDNRQSFAVKGDVSKCFKNGTFE